MEAVVTLLFPPSLSLRSRLEAVEVAAEGVVGRPVPPTIPPQVLPARLRNAQPPRCLIVPKYAQLVSFARVAHRVSSLLSMRFADGLAN